MCVWINNRVLLVLSIHFFCFGGTSVISGQGFLRPVAAPVASPVVAAPTTSGDNRSVFKCGGAVNTGGASANATCTSDLWTPTQNPNMHCYAYGGVTDPCALHNNNDANDGLFKSPINCDRDTFYLWDEPDTQGKSYTWAGQEWLSYSNRYAEEIQTLRRRGVQFTSPLLKAGPPGVTVSNLNAFYAACGSQCRNQSSPSYINVNAVNAFVGPWNAAGIQGCQDAANYMVNEIKAYFPTDNLPWYITNWSRLGTFDINDQIDAMNVIHLFFQSGSPIERIYWFGATDYGGNSGNNVLTQARKLRGKTLGQIWGEKCDTLSTATSSNTTTEPQWTYTCVSCRLRKFCDRIQKQGSVNHFSKNRALLLPNLTQPFSAWGYLC